MVAAAGGAAGASGAGSVVVSGVDTAGNYGRRLKGDDAWAPPGRSRLAVPSPRCRRVRTKRGDERTPLEGDARRPGLRRELRRAGRRPRTGRHRRPRAGHRPLRDRRAPDLRLRRPDRVAARTGARRSRCARRSATSSSTPRTRPPACACRGRSPPSTTASCAGCCGSSATRRSRRRRWTGRRSQGDDHVVHTDRGELSAPLVVDALGWRRMLGRGGGYQPPDAPLSRGLEVHPWGASRRARDLDRPRLRAGRLRLELPGGRRGAGRASARSTPATTSRSRPSASPRTSIATPSATRATGSRTGCARAADDGVFFAGDSAGHCLPLTAEGIRTALYFGIACGRELRPVVEGQGRERRAAPLPRLLGTPPLEVRVDAARAAAGAPGAAAAARAVLRGRWSERSSLVVRPLPANRPPGVRAGWRRARASRPGARGCGLAHDQVACPASSRATPSSRSQVIGVSSKPRTPMRSITTEA